MALSFYPSRPSHRGATALVALCLTAALGVAVGSFLALTTHSHQLSVRQFQNERARELTQIGLEEALWALNQNIWTTSGPTGTDAWSTSGANRTVTLNYGALGNGANGEVTLTVANYASAGPVWPTITVAAEVTLSDGTTITKTVQATTNPAPLFGNAIASAEGGVSFDARGTVDSWNSDPDNNPLTPAVGYTFTAGNASNYAAVVAGNTDGTNGVVLTQAQVRGYVATFGQPATYSLSGSPPGKILGPATATGVNVDMNRLGRSAFVPIDPVFSVVLPSTSGATYGGLLFNLAGLLNDLLVGTPPPASVDTYKINGDLYLDGSFLSVLLGSANLTVDRPLKLIVTGNVTIANGLLGTRGKITIKNTGSLQIFVAGNCTIGADGIENQTQDPTKCVIISTSMSTGSALTYNTTEDFYGLIYCENKPIDIQQNATFYGALLSRRQIRFTAGATAPVFHYDTALRTTRFSYIKTPYVIRQLTTL